jgi:hypothetical protein
LVENAVPMEMPMRILKVYTSRPFSISQGRLDPRKDHQFPEAGSSGALPQDHLLKNAVGSIL